jgi:hypothetical protein
MTGSSMSSIIFHFDVNMLELVNNKFLTNSERVGKMRLTVGGGWGIQTPDGWDKHPYPIISRPPSVTRATRLSTVKVWHPAKVQDKGK